MARRVLALLVPAMEPWPCQVLTVDVDALVADGPDGARPVHAVLDGAVSEGLYVFHARRPDGALPDNPRAAVLAAGLGFAGWDVRRRMRGDVLVTGVDARSGWAADLPGGILVAAAVGGVAVDVGAVPLERRSGVLTGHFR